MPVARPTCRDCQGLGLPLTRKAPYPGPRCATHNRERKKASRNTAHARRLQVVYSITAEFYALMLAIQGHRCAICQRATGRYKRLSVDHDHKQAVLDGHEPDKGCMNCVRGLLCSTCNKTLGHLRDDPLAFERGAEYLREWPSHRASAS